MCERVSDAFWTDAMIASFPSFRSAAAGAAFCVPLARRRGCVLGGGLWSERPSSKEAAAQGAFLLLVSLPPPFASRFTATQTKKDPESGNTT